jgi:hypothetical protein
MQKLSEAVDSEGFKFTPIPSCGPEERLDAVLQGAGGASNIGAIPRQPAPSRDFDTFRSVVKPTNTRSEERKTTSVPLSFAQKHLFVGRQNCTTPITQFSTVCRGKRRGVFGQSKER